ncbi:hypothetical protein HC752_03085 [Vibrio sp. S9_S30]|uniref:hypothetical protein n=1 Tax=Vibrio sp. S9_S30 TaxID=2720226 RepID=UPI0016818F1C|nr:hypothetical protein [Vibrio sp. S9_S30]MBD1555907.1 hypothetical protein [Vibrio sp. S9_S30]
MIRRSEGYITLTITSFILLAALILVMGSYKQVFFQIKRAQNEVKSRQEHWVAEGGLECGFASMNIRKLSSIPNNLMVDCNDLSLSSLMKDASNESILVATSGKTVVKKEIAFFSSKSQGAIRSTSNLIFRGDYKFTADPGTKKSADKWNCKIIQFQGTLGLVAPYENSALKNNGFDDSNKPYSTFPSGQTCAATHLTTNFTKAKGDGIERWELGATKQDIEYKENVGDLFEDVFGVSRKNWKQIKNDPLFHKTSSTSEKCGTTIVNGINDGKSLIWITGSCELSSTDFLSIDSAFSSATKVKSAVIVIENGIFSTRAAYTFPGMFYHLNTHYKPTVEEWNTTESHKNSPINSGLASGSDSISLDKIIYYQTGAFVPSGGYVMDAPGFTAMFNSSMDFMYNRDNLSTPLSQIRKLRWAKGSWNDF